MRVYSVMGGETNSEPPHQTLKFLKGFTYLYKGLLETKKLYNVVSLMLLVSCSPTKTWQGYNGMGAI